jgi:hypothetical protein
MNFIAKIQLMRSKNVHQRATSLDHFGEWQELIPHSIEKEFFLKEFKITGRKSTKYLPYDFTRVLEQFKISGVKTPIRPGKPASKRTPEAKTLVTETILEDPQTSLRRIARKLDFTLGTTYRILREDIKMKPYKFQRSQELTEDHIKQRLDFCCRINSSDIDPQKIIFTDEKWFTLKPHPNHQNTRYWSTSNPFLYDDSIKQGASKILCWAGIIDGRILPLVWFGQGVTINGERYLNLLENNVWQQLKTIVSRREYWFQQDGAPCHCTTANVNFLSDKFNGRVISRRSPFPWPAHSPDLSPLDYWLWNELEQEVVTKKPNDIQELRAVVEQAANNISTADVRNAVASFKKRVELCKKNLGGHIESEV